MADPRPGLRKLVEKVLAGGPLSLALLLEVLVPAATLRQLAREFGLSPKGGFRIDKAPARVLAPLLADLDDAEQLDRVIGTLLPPAPAIAAASAPAAAADAAAADDADPLLQLKADELRRAREELERARQAQNRADQRCAELEQRAEKAEAALQQLRAASARPTPSPPAPREAGDRALQHRVRELEQEYADLELANEALRRQLAADQTRRRELEAELAELEALLPKGKRRKKAVEPPPPPADKRFRLPYLAPSFYRSLDGKDRRSVERALQAILLFCTEGHAYPGLEVKQLGGLDTWSLRASLGLRVYFRQRVDGDVEFVELADREEQHTVLRRLKDR